MHMGKFLDYPAIKRDYPILEVVRLLNITALKPEKGGTSFRGDCPYCQADKTFTVTPKPTDSEWGLAGCFRCGKRGLTNLQLVMDFKQMKVLDAGHWIVEQFSKSTVQPNSTVQKSTVLQESASTGASLRGGENKSFPPLTYLQSDHEAVMQIGFATEFAAKVGIGYAPKGILRGFVAIPIRDENGTLLGYIGIEEAKLPANFTANVVEFPKTA